jgi:hypothetical protein
MRGRATIEARTETVPVLESAGIGARRPWSHKEILWLRVLKSPEVQLRPCDWIFLDQHLGRSRSEVRRQLIDLGLIAYGRRYAVNDLFFDAWSPEVAWVLGLLMADGHLSRVGSTVHLSSVDRELVEKVRTCLQATHPIRVTDGGPGHKGNKPLHVLAINRQRLRTAIDRVVGGRLKAERAHVPQVPAEFLRDFVRGYFEGDGSTFFDERRGNLSVQVSGATPFVAGLRLCLEAAGIDVPPSIYRCPQARDTSTLQFQGAKAVRFADFLYRDVNPDLALERKRAVYLRCLEWRRARGLEQRHAV